jgi:hypothetical protein
LNTLFKSRISLSTSDKTALALEEVEKRNRARFLLTARKSIHPSSSTG